MRKDSIDSFSIPLVGVRTNAHSSSFVPRSTNDTDKETFAVDTLQFDGIIVDAKQLHRWLSKHYAAKKEKK